MPPLLIRIAAIAVLALAACSVQRRSDQLACTTSGDCQSPRTCVQGYCVTAGSGSGSCPSACSSCDTSTTPPTCQITVTSGGHDIDCPSDYKCEVICTGDQACGDVKCGDDACTVICTGDSACGNIDCSSSCSCQVTCTGSCGNNSCPSGRNGDCKQGSTCTKSGAGCNAC